MKKQSYESINYNLRPAKSVERKMLCESFLRLSEFAPLSSYQYVGFGSAYFSDFSLFHRRLGIHNMTSIEDESDPIRQKRFEFNLPFKCVKMRYEKSTVVLPTLDFQIRSIVWLDYDYGLDESVLDDLYTLASNMIPGSILIVSVNAIPFRPSGGDRLENLKNNVGEENVPIDVVGDDLAKWGTAKVYRRIINNKIEDVINERNSCKGPGFKYLYEQLYNFHYKDGANMLSVGGIIYDEGLLGSVAKCRFSDFDFYKNSEDPYEIVVPNLTSKEVRSIDAHLPSDNLDLHENIGLATEDLENYKKIYRYFPAFTETEF